MTRKKKKKQSPGRNDDTKFMNLVWREAEEAKARRSQEIIDREQLARKRARAELFKVLQGWASTAS